MSEVADVYLTNFRIDENGVEELQTNSGAIFLIAIPDVGKRDKLLVAFANAGLDLNEESHLDNDGHTPLNIAIMNNDVELVALLIELGAKVTIKKSPQLINGIDYLSTAVKVNADIDMTAMKKLINKQALVERVAVNTF
ncbi:ankyrin repeat domain-containing protein [Moritella sp. 28]|uniref:ankyrin repeat domain-containing protein n=1 Tax=Moritella sp. 28 TaxID=2746232 RepID=UPI001BAE03D8|nr:ankyrin repeat domain-containing protein [Moritella sp. 28]QUM86315.1 ankyrin repeat domain-containing protein [Moritella sp. 28]